jgi:HPt (histidine-containing phosphotransfer) domain-containing protein
MTLEECYTQFEGDYEGTIERLLTEKRIRKYLAEFLKDQDFADLEKGMESGDDRMVFMAAHTLKGLALNLGMSALAKSSSALTEALRGGRKPEADELMVKCKTDYEMTEEAIRRLLADDASPEENS